MLMRSLELMNRRAFISGRNSWIVPSFGYEQVLWLDGVNRKYVEEVGSMNVMFLIDGKVMPVRVS